MNELTQSLLSATGPTVAAVGGWQSVRKARITMGLFSLFTLLRSSFALSFLNDKGDSDINELVPRGKEKCHQSPGHQFLIMMRGWDPRWMTPERGEENPALGQLMQRADSLEKTLMLGKTEGRRRRDKMVGWNHWLSGHEFEQTLGDSGGQGSLACCSPWGHKESDTT